MADNKHTKKNSLIQKYLEGPSYLTTLITKHSYFVSGPPFLNENIHWGTVYNLYLKNFYEVAEYTLNNTKLTSIKGYDIHGLPTDLKVRKKLGYNKKDVINNSDKFISCAQNYVSECIGKMSQQINSLGLNTPVTQDNYYSTNSKAHYEIVWSTYNILKKKNLIYHKLRCRAHCINCSEGLSNIQIESSKKTIYGWYYRFKIKNSPNIYILVWTTSYWTLPGTCGLAYNKYANYALWFNTATNTYYYAQKFISKQIRNSLKLDYVKEVHICEISNLVYTFNKVDYQLGAQNWVQHNKNKSTSNQYLTGFVNIVPMYGDVDLEYAVTRGIKCEHLITEDGYYLSYFDKNIRITDYNYILEQMSQNILLTLKLNKEVDVCYRCKSVTISYASRQYFLKVLPRMKQKIIRATQYVNYNHESYKQNFIDWIKNSHDWCISRARVYGIPIPQLRNKSFSSFEQLGINSVSELYTNLKKFERQQRVFDCWFQSGCVHIYAYKKYGSISKYFLQGCDQIRGWLYTSSLLFMYLYNTLPYESVHMHGFLLVEKNKLSKSKLGQDYNFLSEFKQATKGDTTPIKLFFYALLDWRHTKFNLSNLKIYEKKWNIILSLLQYFDSQQQTTGSSKYEHQMHKFLLVFENIYRSINKLYFMQKSAIAQMDITGYTHKLIDLLVNKISRIDFKILKLYDKHIDSKIKTRLYSKLTENIIILLLPYLETHNLKCYQYVGFNRLIIETIISCQQFALAKVWVNSRFMRTKFSNIIEAYDRILRYRGAKKLTLKQCILIDNEIVDFSQLDSIQREVVIEFANVLPSATFKQIDAKLVTILKHLNAVIRAMYKKEILEIQLKFPSEFIEKLQDIPTEIIKHTFLNLPHANLKWDFLVTSLPQFNELPHNARYRVYTN